MEAPLIVRDEDDPRGPPTRSRGSSDAFDAEDLAQGEQGAVSERIQRPRGAHRDMIVVMGTWKRALGPAVTLPRRSGGLDSRSCRKVK